MKHLALMLVKDALPRATEYSASYGGQWTSPWCVVMSRSGDAGVQRLTLMRNEKEAQDRGELLLYPAWRMQHTGEHIVAWAYTTDAQALFKEKTDGN